MPNHLPYFTFKAKSLVSSPRQMYYLFEPPVAYKLFSKTYQWSFKIQLSSKSWLFVHLTLFISPFHFIILNHHPHLLSYVIIPTHLHSSCSLTIHIAEDIVTSMIGDNSDAKIQVVYTTNCIIIRIIETYYNVQHLNVTNLQRD